MAQNSTHINQLATVAIPVTDPDRAIGFYVGVLGFEKRMDAQFGQGQRWVEVAPAGAATTIALAPPGESTRAVDTGIRLSTGDCEADHRELRARGVDADDIQHWPGVPPMFSLRDPDGNTLYVVEQADRNRG
jgi:catechol 2,3-dioxygenase-like lactoylglutathione lyase family enzyme